MALGLSGQIARQVGHRVAPERFLEGADESGDLVRATRAYQRLGETFWFDNDVPRLADAALRALNLAERREWR